MVYITYMTKAYEKTKRFQNKCRAKGLCSTGCKKPLRTKYFCDECSKKASYKNNRVRNKKRLALIGQGICSTDKCGKPLVSKWLCRKCQDKCNVYAINSYRKNIIENRAKHLKHSHNYRFSGLRPAIIERDKNTCQICFWPDKKIMVHHIDENNKNNIMDNLICLCNICHLVVERINRNKPNLKHLFPWSLL